MTNERYYCDGCASVSQFCPSPIHPVVALCGNCEHELQRFCRNRGYFPSRTAFMVWQHDSSVNRERMPEAPFYLMRNSKPMRVTKRPKGTVGEFRVRCGLEYSITRQSDYLKAEYGEIWPVGFGARSSAQASVRAPRVLWAQEQAILKLQLRRMAHSLGFLKLDAHLWPTVCSFGGLASGDITWHLNHCPTPKTPA